MSLSASLSASLSDALRDDRRLDEDMLHLWTQRRILALYDVAGFAMTKSYLKTRYMCKAYAT